VRLKIIGHRTIVRFSNAIRAYNCQQLAEEAQRVSAHAAEAAGAQDGQATSDAVVTTAAVVVFWPAAFFVGGDEQNAAELARLRGQMDAIEQTSIRKKCRIQLRQGAAGNEDCEAWWRGTDTAVEGWGSASPEASRKARPPRSSEKINQPVPASKPASKRDGMWWSRLGATPAVCVPRPCRASAPQRFNWTL
jgi:hypothetical protein